MKSVTYGKLRIVDSKLLKFGQNLCPRLGREDPIQRTLQHASHISQHAREAAEYARHLIEGNGPSSQEMRESFRSPFLVETKKRMLKLKRRGKCCTKNREDRRTVTRLGKDETKYDAPP